MLASVALPMVDAQSNSHTLPLTPVTYRSIYDQITASKRKWTPTEVTAGRISPALIETVHRCLALRHLELPVREMLQEGLKRDLPQTPGIIEALESNMADEDRHDKALNYVVAAHGFHAEAEKVGLRFRDAFLAHPDHPIQKVAILERSVFFVLLPFLRFAGDIGIRTVAADISRDERTHVLGHTAIAKELGLKPSSSLNAIRKAIVGWMFDPLKGEGQYGKDFWIKASDNLYARGKAPELSNTRASRMPAFFEANNNDLPSY